MFAENVIRMYTENTFHSIQISDDLEGWASLIAMALVFGLVAGGTMFGVNTAAEHLTGRDKAQIGQTQTTSASSSGSSNSSGQGTVSEVAANAMPSLVTISTMTVEEMRNFFGAGKSI